MTLVVWMGVGGKITDDKRKKKAVNKRYLVNSMYFVFNQDKKNHVVMVLSFLVTVINMLITVFQGNLHGYFNTPNLLSMQAIQPGWQQTDLKHKHYLEFICTMCITMF